MGHDDELLTMREAASLIPSVRRAGKRLSARVLQRWVRQGKFPGRKIAGAWLVTRGEVNAFARGDWLPVGQAARPARKRPTHKRERMTVEEARKRIRPAKS